MSTERETAIRNVNALRKMLDSDSGWSLVMRPEFERLLHAYKDDMAKGLADKHGGYQVLWQLIAKLEGFLEFPAEQLQINEELLNQKTA